MANWNEMSKAAQKAASTAAHVENYMEIRGKKQLTMTEATTAIWGTSGTGNPNAVRLIEATAAFGFLKIIPHGKRTRYVEVGAKPIPAEAMSQEDKDFYAKMYRDDIQAEADAMERRVKDAIKNDPQNASKVFMSELGSFLGAGKRRR
jgi:hypothetical protein